MYSLPIYWTISLYFSKPLSIESRHPVYKCVLYFRWWKYTHVTKHVIKVKKNNIFCRLSVNYNTQTRSSNICRMEKGALHRCLNLIFVFQRKNQRYGRDRSESRIYPTVDMQWSYRIAKTVQCVLGLTQRCSTLFLEIYLQPWSNTPVCNYQELLQILISWFSCVWSGLELNSPGTGLCSPALKRQFTQKLK